LGQSATGWNDARDRLRDGPKRLHVRFSAKSRLQTALQTNTLGSHKAVRGAGFLGATAQQLLDLGSDRLGAHLAAGI
jgi:hypothetical protein